jgi:hypothetical protein
MNSVGAGKVSLESSAGPTIVQGPESVEPVQVLRNCEWGPKTSLNLTWANSFREPIDGQQITSYKLFWDSGKGTGNVIYPLPLDNSMQTNYTLHGLGMGAPFKFTVCA